jgi:uridine kinase
MECQHRAESCRTIRLRERPLGARFGRTTPRRTYPSENIFSRIGIPSNELEHSVSTEIAAEEFLALIGRVSASMILVAIDGHSAAGKSTLARMLQTKHLDAAVVQTDDFYRPLDPSYRATLDAAAGCAEYYDWQRLEAQVLRPLRSGTKARYQKYEWGTNELGDWTTIDPSGLVIVEGCYSARPELKSYYDAIAFVAASQVERKRRQHLRNDASDAWLGRWEAAERYYLDRFDPESYADLVLPGQ